MKTPRCSSCRSWPKTSHRTSARERPRPLRNHAGSPSDGSPLRKKNQSIGSEIRISSSVSRIRSMTTSAMRQSKTASRTCSANSSLSSVGISALSGSGAVDQPPPRVKWIHPLHSAHDRSLSVGGCAKRLGSTLTPVGMQRTFTLPVAPGVGVRGVAARGSSKSRIPWPPQRRSTSGFLLRSLRGPVGSRLRSPACGCRKLVHEVARALSGHHPVVHKPTSVRTAPLIPARNRMSPRRTDSRSLRPSGQFDRISVRRGASRV